MDAKNKLLDKARSFCSRPSDKALSERMGVAPQLISLWRKGHAPMPADRVTELCAIAHEDAASWLVLIAAEQSTGATHRAWEKVIQRLGIAAALVLAVLPYQAPAGDGATSQNPRTLSIM